MATDAGALIQGVKHRDRRRAALAAVEDWYLNRGCHYSGLQTPTYLAVMAALNDGRTPKPPSSVVVHLGIGESGSDSFVAECLDHGWFKVPAKGTERARLENGKGGIVVLYHGRRGHTAVSCGHESAAEWLNAWSTP